MASLIKRENGTWYCVYSVNGKRRWKSLKTQDRHVAKQIFNKLAVKIDQQRSGVAPRRLKLTDAIEAYLEHKKATLKPRTLEQYRQQSLTILRLVSVEYCNKLTGETIIDYVKARQAEGRANKTIKEELCTIKAALQHAIKSGLLAEMPIKDWPTLKIIPVAPDSLGHYSLAEIETLKLHFKGRSFEPVFLFALYTGCRRGELEALRAKDVNLAEKVVRIRNAKTESNASNQFRVVPLHDRLLPTLLELCRKKKPTDVLFPILSSNKQNYPAKVMSRACRACGVPYKRFHGIRHTTATYLLAAGSPLRDVMTIMGWTRLETAQRYIHMANDAAEQIAKLPY